MGIIRTEDILAYRVGNYNSNSEIVCLECVSDDESNEATEETFILRDEIERSEELYFCDRCKKRIE
ncbi:MAG: hypothetical protein ABSF77_18550 [Spirochaetia bacterium]